MRAAGPRSPRLCEAAGQRHSGRCGIQHGQEIQGHELGARGARAHSQEISEASVRSGIRQGLDYPSVQDHRRLLDGRQRRVLGDHWRGQARRPANRPGSRHSPPGQRSVCFDRRPDLSCPIPRSERWQDAQAAYHAGSPPGRHGIAYSGNERDWVLCGKSGSCCLPGIAETSPV